MEMKTCGGHWSLQTGSILIGGLLCICSLCSVIKHSIDAAQLDSQTDTFHNNNNDMAYVMTPTTRAVTAGSIVFSIITLILSCLLIIGSTIRERNLIFPAMYSLFTGIIYSLGAMIGAILYFYHRIHISGDTIVWSLIVYIVAVAILTYMYHVINSFYQQLSRQ